MTRAFAALLLVLTLGEVTGVLDALVAGCCTHEATAAGASSEPCDPCDPGSCGLCPCCHGITLGPAAGIRAVAPADRRECVVLATPRVTERQDSSRPFHPPRTS